MRSGGRSGSSTEETSEQGPIPLRDTHTGGSRELVSCHGATANQGTKGMWARE